MQYMLVTELVSQEASAEISASDEQSSNRLFADPFNLIVPVETIDVILLL